MQYNDKLRLFFKNKELSQKEVAERLGYAPAMISRFLRGESSFGPDFIVTLIKEFPDVNLQYIFSEDNKNIISESKPFYGLNEENLVEELKIIEEKVAKVREYLAQNRHKV